MASTSEPLPRFDRYEALFRIAAGGMAEVFAARIRGEAGFEKFVAVKRMLPHLAEDERFVDMFLDEARLAVHVASPHVVQTLDLGRAEDGALYIAMELVVGCSLANLHRELRRNNQRVPLPIALEILAQAAQGLDDAHEAVTPAGAHLGIVHRDVSPHNLLIGVDGRTRVSDFGIARAMLRRTATAAGEVKGKFAYFSPEQAEGQQVDRRSDIFALGVVAWECLLGRRLFGGGDMLEVLAMVRSHPIAMLHELDPAIPRAVSQAVARALARPVDERYATAHQFAAALREAAREVGPAPSPRELGKWVAETGAEYVNRIRSQLDSAYAGDDAKTVAREPARSARSGAGPRASDESTGSAPAATAPSPAVAPAESSTLAASTLPSTTLLSPAAPAPRAGRAFAVGALVSAGMLGAFFGARQMASSDAPAASASAPGSQVLAPQAAPSAAPADSAAPQASASAEPAKAPKGGKALAGSKAGPGAKTAAAAATQAPAATTTAAATTAAPATAAPTAPPTPPPEKKGPTGPLLGDDAFKVPR